MTIRLRPGEANDFGFVIDSWIRSYRDSPWARLAGTCYVAGHDALIKRLMTRSATTVACYEADPDTILGWACTEGRIVHYVYVKHSLRRKGIARMLLTPYLTRGGVAYTHLLPSKPKNDNGLKAPEGWHFDLYALMG